MLCHLGIAWELLVDRWWDIGIPDNNFLGIYWLAYRYLGWVVLKNISVYPT